MRVCVIALSVLLAFRYQSASMSVPWRQRCGTILTHHGNKPPILCSMSGNLPIEYGGECGALLIYGLRVYISPWLLMCVTLMTTYWANLHKAPIGWWWMLVQIQLFICASFSACMKPLRAHKMYSLLMNWHYTECLTTAEPEQERAIYNGEREKHKTSWITGICAHSYSNVWAWLDCFRSCV